MKDGPRRQAKQIDMARQDVLADIAGPNDEAFRFQLIQQFPVQQMDLAEIGLRRVAGDTGAMLHSRSRMAVAFHAQAGQEVDPHPRLLAEMMAAALTDSLDDPRHPVLLLAGRQPRPQSLPATVQL